MTQNTGIQNTEILTGIQNKAKQDRSHKSRKREWTAVLFAVFLLVLGGCGVSRKDSTNAGMSAAQNQAGLEDAQSTADLADSEADGTSDAQDGQTLYMIIKNDLINRQITLMDLSGDSQICYEYTEGTEFFDKYGNYTLSEQFSEGKLAAVRRLNSNETLGAIAFTDDTWEYENVHNYSVDPQKNRFTIADTTYQYDTSLRVFSGGSVTDLGAVGDSDILNVYGIGRKIYSIVVETGHGTLALTNTELFEGGWLNLGTKVYTKITRDMTMDIPEGVYEFSVANDGYGDTGEILIRRDKITTIDLNDYKGEGPKMCTLTFNVGIKGAILTIDGKKIKYSKPMDLKYGVYKLGVYAEGYDSWEKQLVINSPTANIDIVLSEETQEEGNEASSGNNNTDESSGNTSSGGTGRAGSKAGSMAGSMAGSSGSSAGSSSAGSSSSNGSAAGALANTALGSSLASIITGGNSTDYLDTLSDLIDSLDKLNRQSSSSN